MSGAPRRIAIIGSGISGLVVAHRLHARHEITVFEAASEVGGHTRTLEVGRTGVQGGERGELKVDIGFIVYNDRTYPNFVRLLDDLGVETEESDMSFSVSDRASGFEYCGSSRTSDLFARRRNALDPTFYRMVYGILRFHRQAAELVHAPADLRLGEYLERERFPRPFVERYLLPMTSAIWSTETEHMLDFPVRTLASFLDNHGMLQVENRPQWRVVRGGSRAYVAALTDGFADRIRTATPVVAVCRRSAPADGTGAVELQLGSGESARFDAVVFATHSDQALRMLGDDASAAERQVLGAIPYRENEVVLHTDRSLLPRRRRAWASWNYHLDLGASPDSAAGARQGRGTQLTYWMNRLQNLEADEEFCVTLNRTHAIDPATILHRQSMAHPQFVAGSEAAKARWSEISRGTTHFCGAYWGFGFHEDGVRSGLRVAEALGAEPWGVQTAGIDGHDRALRPAAEGAGETSSRPADDPRQRGEAAARASLPPTALQPRALQPRALQPRALQQRVWWPRVRRT